MHPGIQADRHAIICQSMESEPPSPVLEAAQDGDGVDDRGLADVHLLEAPLQCGVLLDVLPVLVLLRARPSAVVPAMPDSDRWQQDRATPVA